MKLTQTLSYGFSNSIIKAKKGRLLKDPEIQSLIQSDSISEAVSVLDNTVYGDALYGETQYKEIDKALLHNLVDVELDVRKYAPEPLQEVIDLYLKRWEVQNIKIALRIVKSNRSNFREKYFPYETKSLQIIESAANSENLQEAGKILAETEYSFLEDVLQKDTEELLEPELRLDRYYYTNLMKEIKDKERTIKDFFGIQIDEKNLKTALRAVIDDLDEEDIQEFILPPYKLSIEVIEEIISSEDLSSALTPLESTYLKDLANLKLEQKKTTLPLNLEIKRILRDMAKEIYRKETLGPGVILGFLLIKKYEIENLRKIFAYKRIQWPEKKIKERVL